MKRKIKASIKVIILSFILVFINYSNISGNENDNIVNDGKSVYTLQIEERANLLKKALDEFGATSKEQVINIYAKGVKIRSGPLQYSVMCKELKEEFAKTMEEDENYAWVTGASSPWVTDYKIMNIKKESNNEYKATLVFFLETSSGPFKNSKTILTINHKNNKWCITRIQEEIQ